MKLVDRYRFFKEHAGYVVGESAVCAMRLARAEATAERRGLTVLWEDETEEWDGDCPTPEVCLYGAVYKLEDIGDRTGNPRKGARIYAGIGMVGLDGYSDPYMRVVAAELYREALDGEIDAEDEEAAEAMAARATYAGGVV